MSFVDEEAYKVQLPGWLTTVAPDIVNWQTASAWRTTRSAACSKTSRGDWNKNGWDEQYASTKEASSYNGKQYAAPTVLLLVGHVLSQGSVPEGGHRGRTEDVGRIARRLQEAEGSGIAPIAVAGRDAWTLAGWFDYLDLRINGNAFHQKLMAGEVPYTDPRVKKVYTTWKN